MKLSSNNYLNKFWNYDKDYKKILDYKKMQEPRTNSIKSFFKHCHAFLCISKIFSSSSSISSKNDERVCIRQSVYFLSQSNNKTINNILCILAWFPSILNCFCVALCWLHFFLLQYLCVFSFLVEILANACKCKQSNKLTRIIKIKNKKNVQIFFRK